MPDDPKPNALARDLMQWATLAQIRDDATELGAMVREGQRPLPTLPSDATKREKALMDLLAQGRDREMRLLTVIASELRLSGPFSGARP